MMYCSADLVGDPSSKDGQTMLTWSYSKGTLPWFTSMMWSVLSIRKLQRARNTRKHEHPISQVNHNFKGWGEKRKPPSQVNGPWEAHGHEPLSLSFPQDWAQNWNKHGCDIFCSSLSVFFFVGKTGFRNKYPQSGTKPSTHFSREYTAVQLALTRF